MPRIILKHKSPEYADANTATNIRQCEMPGCLCDAEHKAPKHRALDEYFHFCLNHAREYNKAWDFFSGMSEREVQNHMHSSLYGDRPTWVYTADGNAEDHLRSKVHDEYYYGDEARSYQESTQSKTQNAPPIDSSTPEHEAMAIMGLSPPVTMEDIKTRYKLLAKKYHPDLNRNNPEAEELLKKVNMSYTILKMAFEEYRKLPEHKF